MINSKEDYFFYLEADKISARVTDPKTFREKIERILYPNLVWTYQKLLRKNEYYTNCRKDIFGRIYTYYLQFRLKNLGYKLGFIMFPNVFGPGLRIAHYPQILVHGNCVIGENCNIFQGVTVGMQPRGEKGPRIRNNVYIGAGAKIVGDIDIADGVVIGANAVVTKSISEPNITVAGVPARKISDKGSKGLILDSTNVIRQRISRKE